MTEEYISLRPSDAVKGGGVIAEGDYEITDAKFIPFDYGGTVSPAVPSLAIEFTNADGASSLQCYSAGDGRNVAPSADFKRLRKVGSSGGLNDSTNAYLFMSSLITAGFPEDQISNDISVVIGVKCQVIHQALQARDIKGKTVAARTIPVIGKIHSMPGEKEKPKKSGTASKAAAAPKGNGAADTTQLQPKAAEILVTVLKAAEGNQLDKKKLTSAAFQKFPANDPDRAGVLNLLIQDAFLNSLGDLGVIYDANSSLVMYVGG